jgi:DNA-binding MarR family transcriptional regulator
MQKGVYELLALADGLTTYHYRILFLLLGQDGMTQSKLAEKLDLNRQNCHKVCKELLNRNIIYVSREEGKNKYLSINEKIKDTGIKGQLKLSI